MNQYQRAMQVWSILVFAAKNQKRISYEELGKLIGVPTPRCRDIFISNPALLLPKQPSATYIHRH